MSTGSTSTSASGCLPFALFDDGDGERRRRSPPCSDGRDRRFAAWCPPNMTAAWLNPMLLSRPMMAPDLECELMRLHVGL